MTMQAWIDWARGPAFLFAFSFMVLGLVRHVVLTLWEIRRTLRRAGDKSLPVRQVLTATTQWLVPVSKLRNDPLFSATSMLFHVGILIVPVFLAGHIALWERGTGLSWPAISSRVADALTILAVVAAVALVVQRRLVPAARALSRTQDYLLPLLIAVPFATGFLVMHPMLNPFTYEATLLTHILSANLVLVLIPITKLSHAVLVPSVHLVAELGWHWPARSGTNVAVALGKEQEPV